MTESNAGEPKAHGSEPGRTQSTKSDLKSLSLLEAENNGEASPDGLNQAEPQQGLSQDGPNAIEGEKSNPLLRNLDSLLGPIRG